MTDSGDKKVVFRVAGVGFSLEVSALMEIRDASDVTVNKSSAAPEQLLLGSIPFRDDLIDLVDVRTLLGLPLSGQGAVLVVVLGSDGAWAFPVDKIEGVDVCGAFRSCAAPWLLQGENRRLFETIDIWRQEPLVCFEPTLVEQQRVALC